MVRSSVLLVSVLVCAGALGCGAAAPGDPGFTEAPIASPDSTSAQGDAGTVMPDAVAPVCGPSCGYLDDTVAEAGPCALPTGECCPLSATATNASGVTSCLVVPPPAGVCAWTATGLHGADCSTGPRAPLAAGTLGAYQPGMPPVCTWMPTLETAFACTAQCMGTLTCAAAAGFEQCVSSGIVNAVQQCATLNGVPASALSLQ